MDFVQSTARRVLLKAYLSSDHITPATGKTIAVVISKNGGSFGNPSAGSTNATAISNGWYYVDISTTDTASLGPLVIRGTEGTIDDTEFHCQVVTGLSVLTSAYDAAKTAAQAGDVMKVSSGTGSNQISLSSGTVTVGTNSDKTGYSLTSAYDPSKTASQAGDVMKVSSGTGANQISLSSGTVTVGTNSDKTGYALTSAYDAAKTAAQAGNAMTLTSGERDSVAAALLGLTNGVETSLTVKQCLRLMAAALYGKSTISGTSYVFRDVNDSADRISSTASSTGRSAVSLSP